MEQLNLATLVNETGDSSLIDRVGRLKRSVGSCPHQHYFFSIYIAARGNLYDAITDYLASEIGIPSENKIDLLIPPREVSYQNILSSLQDRLITCLGDVVLLKVKGFQDVDRLGTEYGISRTGHDFNQALFEDNTFQSNWRVPKKCIIAVHLNPDQNNYEKAFQSAGSDGFQMGIWNFDQAGEP